MSRAFGNRLLKRYVVAEPEIQVSRNSKCIYNEVFLPSCYFLRAFIDLTLPRKHILFFSLRLLYICKSISNNLSPTM